MVGDAIKAVRLSRTNLSARALSLKCELSPSYVGKVESGEIEPSFRAFARIAVALGMTEKEMSFLVYNEGTF